METAEYTFAEEPADDTSADSPVAIELGDTDSLAVADEVADLADETGLAGTGEIADLEDTRDNRPDTAPVPDTDEDVGSDERADAGLLEPEVGDIDDLDGTDGVADIETEIPEARDSTGGIERAAGVVDSSDQSHTDVLAADVAEIDELDGVDDVADIDSADDVAFQTTDERSGAAGVDADMVETRPGNPAGLADVEAMDDAKYVAQGDLEDRGAAQALAEQSAGAETSIEADGRADGDADRLLETDPQNPEIDRTPAAVAEGLPAAVGPEQTELYHNPEDVVEKEPGLGPKPSWSEAPDSPLDKPPPVDGPPPPGGGNGNGNGNGHGKGGDDPYMRDMLEQLDDLRAQQQQELQEDIDKFNNRPEPPYYQPEPELDLNTLDQLRADQYQDLQDDIHKFEERPVPSYYERSEEAETTTIAGIEDQATATESVVDQSGTTLVEPGVDQRGATLVEPGVDQNGATLVEPGVDQRIGTLTEHEESKPNEVGMPTGDATTTEKSNSSEDLLEKTSTSPGSLERDDGMKLNEQIEGGVPEGYDGHHLIGINEAKDSIALQEAVEAGYNINNGHNGIALPTTIEEAEQTGLPLHTGRHLGEYTTHVSKWLEILDEEYIRAQEVGKPWSQEQLLERVGLIEDAVRDEILSHKVSLQSNDPHKKL